MSEAPTRAPTSTDIRRREYKKEIFESLLGDVPVSGEEYEIRSYVRQAIEAAEIITEAAKEFWL